MPQRGDPNLNPHAHLIARGGRHPPGENPSPGGWDVPVTPGNRRTSWRERVQGGGGRRARPAAFQCSRVRFSARPETAETAERRATRVRELRWSSVSVLGWYVILLRGVVYVWGSGESIFSSDRVTGKSEKMCRLVSYNFFNGLVAKSEKNSSFL